MNRSYALRLGLILGGISVIIFLIQAIVTGGIMFSLGIGLIAIALIIAMPTYFIRKQRKEQAGFISFGEAFKTAFFGLVISSVISIVFTIVYTQFIDTGYVERQVTKTLETTMKFMEGNVPEDQMATQMIDIEERTRNGFTPLGLLKSLGIYAIVYAIIALILALIFKKEPEIGGGEIALDH